MQKSFIPFITAALIIGISSTPTFASSISSQSEPITINDNHKTATSSSSILTKLSQPLENGLGTAINFAHSRWVYYTDHNNYLNGYKWSHSNYYHQDVYHSSSAAVSNSDFTKRYANAGQYSIATAAGKGTAQAWYDAPYTLNK